MPEKAKAVEVLRKALEVERQAAAFHDPFTVAYTEGWLAKALRKAGQVEEAAKLRAAAAELLARHPGHARLRAAVE